MNKYWSNTVKNADPYTPGEQPQDKEYIKLNTNENPYPPSPKVINAIKKAANVELRLYPEPTCEKLKKTIADYHNLDKEQVFVGNGSDEVLAFSFMAFFEPDKPVLLPDISYSFYPVYSKLFNIKYKSVPLNDNFSLPVNKFSGENGGIIFPNPNAPTGKFLSLKKIEKVLKQNIEEVVIIDEAYIDFGGESAVKLINQYSNLLIIQTLSKSRALAGLRVGFALGQKHLIEGLVRIKNSVNSYTIDSLAMAGAIEAIKDQKYFQKTRKKIIRTRERVAEDLKKNDFVVINSKTNFLFTSHKKVEAKKLFKRLKERGVLVRYFAEPRIDNFIRVSIGTDREMDEFIDTVKDII